MLLSKLSVKGQVTIPKKVRDRLNAKAGDFIEYELRSDYVTLRRVEPVDLAFHSALSGSLTEWSSPEDEEAFGDL
ncbi:MAG: AbrB/MazE/SpoVT family DNA-binding domain-containing protein [Bryobacteraceae bacterium]